MEVYTLPVAFVGNVSLYCISFLPAVGSTVILPGERPEASCRISVEAMGLSSYAPAKATMESSPFLLCKCLQPVLSFLNVCSDKVYLLGLNQVAMVC